MAKEYREGKIVADKRKKGTMQTEPTVFVVDDDEAILDALSQLLEAAGLSVESYNDGASFLAAYRKDCPGCVLLDVSMPGMDGKEVQRMLKNRGFNIPILFLTGHGDIPMAVEAVQAGALDFLEKPIPGPALLERVRRALEHDRQHREARNTEEYARKAYTSLSPREREVLEQVVIGHPNKKIALNLGISHRTVEVHREHVMRKMGARNIAELINQARLFI